MTNHRFVALDGLRGVAAVAVLLTHAWVFLGHKWLPHGFMAVDFFFALSGFVVAFAYEGRLRAQHDVIGFLIGRRDRLYPMIFLGAVVGLIAALSFQSLPPWRLLVDFVSAALALPSPAEIGRHSATLFPMNGPVWSLFWELCANLVFAIWTYKAKSRTLILIAAAGAIGLALFDLQFLTLEGGFTEDRMPLGLARVTFSFTCGHLLYRAWATGLLPRYQFPAWALAAALVAPMFVAGGQYYPLIDLGLALVWYPAIVAVGAASLSKGRLWKWSGELSFPLYLVHYPVLMVFNARLHPTGFLQRASVTAAFVLVSVGLAYLVLKFYDEPVRAWLGKRRRAKSAALPQVVLAE